MDDPFDLQRFEQAQAPVLAEVRQELAAGRKTSHWMWFVFPQFAGLGHSPTARHYAIRSVAEAQAYLDHTLLGPRLVACTELANQVPGRTANQVFGSPDDLKFRSCVTLFAAVRPTLPVFRAALDRYFAGAPDPLTLTQLARLRGE